MPQQQDDSDFVWFVGRNESWEGPYTRNHILEKIRVGAMSWTDFVWRDGQPKRWIRICEVPQFQAMMPQAPSSGLLREIVRSLTPQKALTIETSPSFRRSVWYLQFEGSEFGPLSMQEVEVILKSGKLRGKLMAWREGMEAWTPVAHITELVRMMDSIPLSETHESDERRKSPRVPLVATVRSSVQPDAGSPKMTHTGVCRDISSTGMLVLCNHHPGSFKKLVHLEVVPLNSSGLRPFSCDADVVHVLPDGKGFSVRFNNLHESEQAAIDRYLSKQNRRGGGRAA